MDPDKAFGEAIHDLSPLERGMYEDRFWSLTPVQAVPEPASLWLVGVGLVGLLGYGWRQRLWQGLLGRPASESGTSCRVDGAQGRGHRSGEITTKNGVIQQSNFNDYPVARITEAPYQTNVHIVETRAPPAGVEEAGVPPSGPRESARWSPRGGHVSLAEWPYA